MDRTLALNKLGGAAAAVAFASALANPAAALSFATAEADGILSIVSDPTGLGVTGTTFDGVSDPALFEETEIGLADAMADGASAFFDTGLDQLALTTADAFPSGIGGGVSEAIAFFGTDGILTIENTPDGGGDIDVELELFYSVFAEAGVDDPGDFAFGFALVELDGAASFDVFAEADTDFGIPSQFFTGTETFSLTLADGAIADLFLLVDATSVAIAMPMPGSLPLLGAGLFGLGLMGLRRKA